MAEVERLTITLPSAIASDVKAAVARGEFESASELVTFALRNWRSRPNPFFDDPSALKAEIDRGLRDVEAGRQSKFDLNRTIERGRQILKGHSNSA